ncbi:MAG: nucleotidyltransferase domain-containing protein, partial [Spirochaetia bacterium]
MAVLKNLADNILDTFTIRCKNHYGPHLVSIVVYGSVARLTHNFNSDIDLLLIIKDLPNGRMSRMNDFAVLEKKMFNELQNAREKGWNIDLSPVIRKPEEVKTGGYFYLDMIDDAQILYDKDNFFFDFLKNLKQRLDEYGAEKRKWK